MRSRRSVTLALLVLCVCGLVQATNARPAVIAHRGASGYLPEHTLASYAMAYAMGADFIEPDVVLTHDGVPICLHDLTLETTTDVAEVFPDRARDDGKFYAIDFDASEIARLQKLGREGGPRQMGHRVPTLAEMIKLVQDLNARTGRTVGIVPEAKHPAFHAEHGWSLPRVLLETLSMHGYNEPGDGCVVQCFDLDALREMHRDLDTALPLVFLAGEEIGDAVLEEVATFCEGVGPRWTLLVNTDELGQPVGATRFAKMLRRYGLRVYPWTFDADEGPLRYFSSEFTVDGVFADYPDVAIRASVAAEAPVTVTSEPRSDRPRTGSDAP